MSCLFFMFFFTLPNFFFCFLSFWPFFLFFFSQRTSGFSTPVFTSEEVYMKVFTLQDKVLFPFPFLWKENTYIAYNFYLYVFNTFQLTFNWYLCRFQALIEFPSQSLKLRSLQRMRLRAVGTMWLIPTRPLRRTSTRVTNHPRIQMAHQMKKLTQSPRLTHQMKKLTQSPRLTMNCEQWKLHLGCNATFPS